MQETLNDNLVIRKSDWNKLGHQQNNSILNYYIQ